MVWFTPARTVGGWLPPAVVTVVVMVELPDNWPSLAVSLNTYTPAVVNVTLTEVGVACAMVAATGPLTWDHCVVMLPDGNPSSFTVPVSTTVFTGNVITVRSAMIATTGAWLVPAGLTVMLMLAEPVN